MAIVVTYSHIEDRRVEVPVRELKDHLSSYLRRVSGGEEIVITSHGKPVGRLVQPQANEPDSEAEAVAQLDAQPWVHAPRSGKLSGSDRPTHVPQGTTEDLMRWLRGE